MAMHDDALDSVPADLISRITELPLTGRRCLVGIAGAPASGKSTLAAALTKELNRLGRQTENVPMDGFHLDNRILDPMNLRARKGAPETFDASGFLMMIQRLREEDTVYYPIFDREQDQAIAGAGCVGPECDLVVVEGNYLLFDAEPWNRLAKLWDLSIWVDTSEELVRARCMQRWLDHGHSPEAATARAEGNDLRNARTITDHRLEADVILRDGAQSRRG